MAHHRSQYSHSGIHLATWGRNENTLKYAFAKLWGLNAEQTVWQDSALTHFPCICSIHLKDGKCAQELWMPLRFGIFLLPKQKVIYLLNIVKCERNEEIVCYVYLPQTICFIWRVQRRTLKCSRGLNKYITTNNFLTWKRKGIKRN